MRRSKKNALDNYMKREDKVIIGMCTIILILFGIRLVLNNIYSTQGSRLGNLLDQTMKLRKENTDLEEKILSISSLHFINTQIRSIGFEDTETYVLR